MITADNILNQIGDIIIFDTAPMLNIQTIINYSDNTTGETSIRTFSRNFQYSLDGGVTFSDWYNLDGINASNITNINTYLQSDFHQLVIRFKYTRTGTDNTGELQINSISVNGTNIDRGSVFIVSAKGLFADTVYNNINVMMLMINLAQKMYENGIVPAYITRQEQENGFMSDQAYIDFWEAIAYFYAIISIDSIKFENIYWNRPLICEFLTEKNVFLCDCTNIIEMQLIAQNFYTEMRVRGTEEIFKPQGYQYNIGYRNTYSLPVSYVIQPSTGVQIDGIVYTEVSDLPFGWTVQGGTVLISSDRNYHQVLFFNNSTSNYDIPSGNQSIVFPTSNSGILKPYDGEYLRLICYSNLCDEFIYNVVPEIFQGWCLSNASPCYQGLRPQYGRGLVKGYEFQADVQDLTKYPLINPSQIFIGIAENPLGIQDTVMYISADGSPCFTNVIPQLLNVSTYLNVNITSSVSQVDGVIKMTNLLTLDEFDIPISLGGQPNFSINTGLVPARYSVELIFTHNGQMVGDVDDGAALLLPFVDLTGNIDQLYNLNNVGSNVINININFSY